jgi:hypothetical protein
VQATRPAEAGGVSAAPECPADIDNSGQVDVVDFLLLLGAWGPCTCDPDGLWVNAQSVSYTCAFGLVNFNIQSWTIVLDQDALTVLGGPVTMNGPPVGCELGNEFTVSGTVPGTCVETYTLSGAFLDADHFEGTFVADFEGDCVDCVDQMFDVSATRG